MILDNLPHGETPLQKLEDPQLNIAGINVYVLRLDLIHPEISGNKWFKLKYNLSYARDKGYDTILTFGGAYSNHIYAAAAAGQLLGLKTIGVIRGEEHLPLNPTLSFASEKGMKLCYLNRSDYRKKHTDEIITMLEKLFGDFYLIPEGGSNGFAVKGCEEIIKLINIPFDYICLPCGTGGTMAGIVSSLNGKNRALGFSVLKGGEFLMENVRKLVRNNTGKEYFNWEINLDYHFGGYAKGNKMLYEFIRTFTAQNNIPVEPVYTGKLFYAVYDLIRRKFFSDNETIIIIHTGGMQGMQGFKERQLFM